MHIDRNSCDIKESKKCTNVLYEYYIYARVYKSQPILGFDICCQSMIYKIFLFTKQHMRQFRIYCSLTESLLNYFCDWSNRSPIKAILPRNTRIIEYEIQGTEIPCYDIYLVHYYSSMERSKIAKKALETWKKGA